MPFWSLRSISHVGFGCPDDLGHQTVHPLVIAGVERAMFGSNFFNGIYALGKLLVLVYGVMRHSFGFSTL
jgi:hypothetical protein